MSLEEIRTLVEFLNGDHGKVDGVDREVLEYDNAQFVLNILNSISALEAQTNSRCVLTSEPIANLFSMKKTASLLSKVLLSVVMHSGCFTTYCTKY